MRRARKWLLGLGITAAVLALALVSLVPSDEELARRAATELEATLGVPVTVGALHWQLLPSPLLVIENAATGQPEPIEVKKLTAHFNKAALWQRRLKVDHAHLQGAVVPQLSLRGLGGRKSALQPDNLMKLSVDEVPLAHIDFQDVTWVSRRGNRIVYEGDAEFEANWRPRTAHVRIPAAPSPVNLTLTRQGQEDRWEARISLGGGTAHGHLQLHTGDNGGLRLTGRLQTRNVEVADALQAFNRRAIVAGKASGETTLSASGATLGALTQSLRTSTPFTMGRATLLRFDLDKAIRSIGKEHAGKTPLDAISGQLDTQNTPQGMVLTYSQIKAHSGALSATGKARVANRQVDAELAVDLVDGVIGVPLKISGPLDKVQVSVPASALAGAAVGTAVLPGIGTAIGARIGAALGQLFGRGAKAGSKTSPAAAGESR